MTGKYNLFQPVDKAGGRTYWHKLGVAFPNKSKNGWSLTFNSLPIPNSTGQVIVHMFEDKPRPEDTARSDTRDKVFEGGEDKPPWDDKLDDDIPF